MSPLLDDLRAIADAIDPSLLPSTNETNKLLGALIHYEDKGKELFEVGAKGAEDLSAYLADEKDKVEAASAGPVAPATTPAASGAAPVAPGDAAPDTTTNQQDEINALRDQIASLSAKLATSQATVVEHETDIPPVNVDTPPSGTFGGVQSSTPIFISDTESK